MQRKIKKLSLIFIVFLLMATNLSTHTYAQEKNSLFKDIKNHWAENVITRLAEMNIIDGFTDGTFRPTQNVSREEFIALAVKMMGYQDSNKKNSFSDVKPTRWSSTAIETALEQKIIFKEDFGKKFYPAKPIKREEMAVISTRILHLETQENDTLPFKDADKISNKDLVAALYREGLIKGFTDKTFKPSATLTRAEAAAIIMRLYDYALQSENPITPTPMPKRGGKDTVELREGVKELKPQTVEALIEIKENASLFIFNGNPKELIELNPGTIFVLPPSEDYPTGLAKKVKTVSVENGNTVIQTTEPDITEVIKELDIQKEVAVTADNIIPGSMEEGVTIEPLSPENPDLVKSANLPSVSIEGFKISIKDLEVEVKGQPVKFNGNIELHDPEVKVDVDYDSFDLDKFHVEFLTKKSIKVEAEAPIASGSIGNNEDGNFDVEGSLPGWLQKKTFTNPFNKEVNLGKFIIPVYGPANVNLQLLLVVEADLTLGVVATFTNDTEIDVGLIITNEEVEKIRKIDIEPNLVIGGEGKFEAKAGPRLGLYFAIFQYDTGGFEGDVGLKGKVMGRTLLRIGEQKESEGEKEEEILLTEPISCFSADIGWFGEINAVIKAPSFINMEDLKLNLFKNEGSFAETSTCDRKILISNKNEINIIPGDTAKLYLDLIEMNPSTLEVKEKDISTNEKLNYTLSNEENLLIEKVEIPMLHDYLKISANKNSKPGEVNELTIKYDDNGEILTKKLTIHIMKLEKIEAEPSELTLKKGDAEQLSVSGVFKRSKSISFPNSDVTLNDTVKLDLSREDGVTFSSLNNNIASVTDTGVVKVLPAAQPGEKTDILIKYKDQELKVPLTVQSSGGGSSGGGSGGGNPTLSVIDVAAIILTAEKEADKVFKAEAEKEEPRAFEEVKPTLSSFYSENYLQSHWKKIYEINLDWFKEPYLLYPLTEAKSKENVNSFIITEQKTDKITATVIVPLNEPVNDYTEVQYQYVLIKQNGRWLLESIESLTE